MGKKFKSVKHQLEKLDIVNKQQANHNYTLENQLKQLQISLATSSYSTLIVEEFKQLACSTSTSDQFCHGKTWKYPRKSMDIATEKRFFSRGSHFVAIATTPNLRRKSDDPFPSL